MGNNENLYTLIVMTGSRISDLLQKSSSFSGDIFEVAHSQE